MPRTFLVDGSALAYRSYFARGPGPAYAYAASLLALLERGEPDYALVCMDTPTPTFRHEAFPAYKATREKTPEELVAQLPTFERIAKALGFPVYALEGWEADDVIGTLALRARAAGHEVFMVTGDKDFMQIVGDKVVMWNPNLGASGEAVVQGVEAVRDKFHCRPEQVTHVLALMGDSSDNVPGVKGVGEKTALKLIEQYEDLDDIYAHLDVVQPKGLRAKLEQGKDDAYLSLDLVTIRTEAPVELELDDLAYSGPDAEAARELFVELDFPSLLARIDTGVADAEQAGRDARIVRTRDDYAAFLAALDEQERVVLDLETTNLVALEAEIVGLAFSWQAGEAWYLPANLSEPIFGPGDRGRTARERAAGTGAGDDMFAGEHPPTTGRGLPDDPLVPPADSDLAHFLADLKPRLEGGRLAVAGQNLKYDLLVLGRYGVRPARIAFDTMLASYCLEAHQSQHNLDFLALKHLGLTKIPTSELIGKGAKQISMWDVPVERCGEYACEDAEVTFRLMERFEQRLAGDATEHVFRDIELPVLEVLLEMEQAGVLVDADHLRRLSAEMGERIEELTREIHELAGGEFTINSPKQLGEVLFEKLAIHEELGVKRLKKTKTGFSTDASVLEQLADHPLPAKVLEYRQLSKLKGTYVDALPELVHPESGRIHTSFNQAVAATGRLSSADPNLQNIPVRTHEGRRIREAFVAPPGKLLLAADYSQVELRLLAHLSGDEAMIEGFREGVDIHRRTASLVFGVSENDVTPELRSRSKAINFGILYGMGAQRLARETGVTVKEAAAFIDQYFAQLPAVKDWLDGQRDRARSEGFVSTLAGRRRKLENLDGKDPRGFAAAMNMAVNTPIQGTAADLIKLAMIRVRRALGEAELDATLILQVHDELVFEVAEGDAEALRELAVEQMAGAMELDVPLVVDTGTGRNWVEAH